MRIKMSFEFVVGKKKNYHHSIIACPYFKRQDDTISWPLMCELYPLIETFGVLDIFCN
jgi:hypothetical protein